MRDKGVELLIAILLTLAVVLLSGLALREIHHPSDGELGLNDLFGVDGDALR